MEENEKNKDLCSFHNVVGTVLGPLPKFISLKARKMLVLLILFYKYKNRGSERLDSLLKSTQLSKNMSVRERGGLAMDGW